MATISSEFSINADGWTVSGDGTLGYVATGGEPGGHIRAVDRRAGQVGYFEAPSKFEGDLSDYYGGSLGFSWKATGGNVFGAVDLVLEGGGLVLVLDLTDPSSDWSRIDASLDVAAGWRVGSLAGDLATEAQIRSVLDDVTRLAIRAEHVDGADTGFLDSVTLATADQPPVSGEVVTSTFDSSAEGWTAIADVASFTHEAAGGNPGGHLKVVDAVAGDVWYFSAPGEYLGDKSLFYGGTLGFDLRTNGPDEFDQPDVVLSGGGLTLMLDFVDPPTNVWQPYDLALNDGQGWRVGSLAGAPATEADIRQVLGDLRELVIRGEFTSGADTGFLDNVVLAAPGTSASSWRLYTDKAQTELTGVFADLDAALVDAAPGDYVAFSNASGTALDFGTATATDSGLTIVAGGEVSGEVELSGRLRNLAVSGAADIDLMGNRAGNTLTGGSGENRLAGEAGDDALGGGDGKDTLIGGEGNDRLVGGKKADTLTGDTGSDLFVFKAKSDSGTGGRRDEITDFSNTDGDKIDLSQLSPGALSFIGAGSFNGAGTGEVRLVGSGDGQRVLIDLAGDGTADMEILVSNSGVVDGGDFIL